MPSGSMSTRMCGGPVSPWQWAYRLIAMLPDNPPSLNPISSPSHLPIRGNPRLSELFDLDAREVWHHEALIVPVRVKQAEA